MIVIVVVVGKNEDTLNVVLVLDIILLCLFSPSPC